MSSNREWPVEAGSLPQDSPQLHLTGCILRGYKTSYPGPIIGSGYFSCCSLNYIIILSSSCYTSQKDKDHKDKKSWGTNMRATQGHREMNPPETTPAVVKGAPDRFVEQAVLAPLYTHLEQNPRMLGSLYKCALKTSKKGSNHYYPFIL